MNDKQPNPLHAAWRRLTGVSPAAAAQHVGGLDEAGQGALSAAADAFAAYDLAHPTDPPPTALPGKVERAAGEASAATSTSDTVSTTTTTTTAAPDDAAQADPDAPPSEQPS